MAVVEVLARSHFGRNRTPPSPSSFMADHVEVDIVGAKPPQAMVDLRHDRPTQLSP
jgi:hypothetical protein